MQVTQDGLALIACFEGFRGEAYRCPAGVWTIGYGHTSAAGPPAVSAGMKISEAEARRVLEADVARFAKDVRTCLTRNVTDAQFSALVSFAFNVGIPAFRGSSVLKAVNEGRFGDVPERMKLWVKAGGKVLPGLERRRAKEVALFMFRPARELPAPAVAGAAAAIVVSGLSGGPLWGLALAFAALAGCLVWRRFRSMQEVR